MARLAFALHSYGVLLSAGAKVHFGDTGCRRP